MKNGRRVTSAEMWWNERRPEIVEDFDREIYGRVPKETPKVNWEVTGTTQEKNGDVPSSPRSSWAMSTIPHIPKSPLTSS